MRTLYTTAAFATNKTVTPPHNNPPSSYPHSKNQNIKIKIQLTEKEKRTKYFTISSSSSSSSSSFRMGSAGENRSNVYQNVVVMRHGDRIDNVDAMWASRAERKWDPELVEAGKVRAFNTGRKLRSNLGFPTHRVFVSPFLRCLQTAAEVVSALCAAVDSDDNFLSFTKSADGLGIDPSKIKVSVEYGLCEMLNTAAIRPDVAPKDGDFGFQMSQCESVLPAGTVDHSVEPVYKELPKWQEAVEGSRSRYVQVVKALADKYPSENLLLVTHGEGVGSVLSTFLGGAGVSEVEYCAYVHVGRQIASAGRQSSSTSGSFEVIGQNGLTLYKE